MADADVAKQDQVDAALLAAEASEPVTLQEPDRRPEAEPQSDAEMAIVPPPEPTRRRNGLLAFVLAGAIVAGVGFAVAEYAFPETGSANAVATLQTQLDASTGELAAIRAEIAELTARPVAQPADTSLADRLAAVEQALTARPDTTSSDARVTALEDRLTAIEAASAGGEAAPAAALAAMDREMKALRSELEAQKAAGPALTADIEAASAAAQSRIDAAEAGAQAAAQQAALSHVRAAFDTGSALGPALDGLKALGAEVPDQLAMTADGLPTLMSLQDSFAEPARAALDAATRADMGAGWADRLSAFMRSQSGVRSLVPREGTDPDAVLSRAEAALRTGDLKTVLAELAGLPPEGAEAMAPWVVEATRRLDAEQAIADLSATLNRQ